MSKIKADLPSICIPCVSKRIKRYQIEDIFIKLNWGKIEKIRINYYQDYNLVFIDFAQWYLNKSSIAEIRQKLIDGDSINVVYNEPWFWICKASFYNKGNRKIIADGDLLHRKRENQSNKIEK